MHEPTNILAEPSSPSEWELVRHAAIGAEWAVGALYDAHADRLYSVIRRLAGEDALAEDWCQESWMRILANLHAFRGESSFATWAHRIAVNTALSSRRRLLRRAVIEHEASSIELRVPPDDAERALLRLRLDAAIDRLPAGMRQVLVLHDIEGYGHEEIAQLIGTTGSNVRSQLARARAKARTLLQEDER